MAATSIFDEDEVCIPTSSGGFKYGLVVESSEYVSTDDDEDEENEDRVQKGKVKVAWHPSGKETVISEEKVLLTDRSLMPGDVVRRLISGKESQRGFVQQCHTKCHVQVLGTDYYLYNIDAKDLKSLQEFDPDTEVTLDSWVGHVLNVTDEVTVRFPCGARCKFTDYSMDRLQDVNDIRKSYSEFALRNYYRGQALCGTPDDYEDVEWLYTTNVRGPKCRAKQLLKASVNVEQIKTYNVDVSWTCKGFTQSGDKTEELKSPPDIVAGDDLKRMRKLDCFEFCHLQIGDKAYYTVKESDIVLHKMSPRNHVTPDIIDLAAGDNVVIGTKADGFVIQSKSIGEKADENVKAKGDHSKETKGENCDKISKKSGNDRINVDVVNEDSEKENDYGDSADDEYEDVEEEISEDSDSDCDSNPSSNHNSPRPARKSAAKFVPGQKKKERKQRERKRKRKGRERNVKAGDEVAVEIWYTFSSCDIMWQDGHVEEKVPSTELFPIHHLDELEFFPGDFVLDGKGSGGGNEYGVVMNSDYKERTVMVKWFTPYTHGQSNIPECRETVEMSVFDIKDHPDYKFRCGSTVLRVGGFQEDQQYEAVGQVYKLDPEGTVQVWWPDNSITKCYPQDLFLPGEAIESSSESSDESDDESDEDDEAGSEVSWETEDEETVSDSDNDKKHKVVWLVDDDKKRELDSLIDRAQGALTGLLDLFVNVTTPFFKNSQQIFQDILAIVKRCKEIEKVLKSSFFEDEKLNELIEDIKDELRKEKTAKLARHVADIYRFRTGVIKECPINETDAMGCSFDQILTEGDKTSNEAGGISDAADENDGWKQCLKDLRNELEDPMLEIIFDSTIASFLQSSDEVRKGEDENKADSCGKAVTGGDNDEAKGGSKPDSDNGANGPDEAGANGASGPVETVGMTVDPNKCHPEVFQSLVKALCDNTDEKLNAKLEDLSRRVNEAFKALDGIADKAKSGKTASGGDKKGHDDKMASDLGNDSAIRKESEGVKENVAKGGEKTGEKIDNDENDAKNINKADSGENVAKNINKADGSENDTKDASKADSDENDAKNTSKADSNENDAKNTSKADSNENDAKNTSKADSNENDAKNTNKTVTSDSAEPQANSDEAKQPDPASIRKDTTVLADSHRTLCIKLCTALKVPLMLIKQEVLRKWIAFKLGCDENISPLELLGKSEKQLNEFMEMEKMEKQAKEKETEENSETKVKDGANDRTETNESKSDLNNVETEVKTQETATNSPLEESKDTNTITELSNLDGLRNPEKEIVDDDGENVKKPDDDVTEESVESEVVDVVSCAICVNKGFEVLSKVPFDHRYNYSDFTKSPPQKSFLTAIRKEWKLLQTSLPEGIFVKAFEDRMDLLSVLIKGPEGTPYEDGLFAFDVQLPVDYPAMPPVFHYVSYCSERLNPNLYEDGKVCVSLLGTWAGKGSELWTVGSNLLQVLVSIQGLILVKEPYFNEAGYERQRGSQHGKENSRMYNEMAILKLLQSMTRMTNSPHRSFHEETLNHLKQNAHRMIERVEHWIDISNKWRAATSSPGAAHMVNGSADISEHGSEQVSEENVTNDSEQLSQHSLIKRVLQGETIHEPAFPLLPVSKGFCITVRKSLDSFKKTIDDVIFGKDSLEVIED